MFAALLKLSEDVASTHSSILNIWTCIAFKAKCFLKVECDNRRPCIFKKKVTECSNRDFSGCTPLFLKLLGWMTRLHFAQSTLDESVDKIIRFYT